MSSAAPAALAQTRHDTQLWLQALATVNLSENWRLHLEEQPRFHDNMSETLQVITRTALGRRLGGRASLWGGYAWIAKPPGPGTTHEHRIWQQFSSTFPGLGSWQPSIRVRLEQRFQDGWADTSHRTRMMGRFVRPLDPDRRWSFVAWNEIFVTLDGTAHGPSQGYDQNRAFAGFLRQVTRKTGVEFGYLWQTSDPPGTPRHDAHVAFAWLNLVL
jgi:hypothetical protein